MIQSTQIPQSQQDLASLWGLLQSVPALYTWKVHVDGVVLGAGVASQQQFS